MSINPLMFNQGIGRMMPIRNFGLKAGKVNSNSGNNNGFFNSEEFSYPKVVLDLMNLYLKLFGTDQATPPKLNYFGPYDLMKRLPEGAQYFDFDDQYDKYLELKKELFSTPGKKEVVFHNSAKHNDFWRAFLSSLSELYPSYYSYDKKNSFTNNITGEVWDLNQQDPFFVAASLVQEDLILLEKNDEGSPIIGDISVCFPARWNPLTAPNRAVKDAHGIVPKLISSKLGDRIDNILNNLKAPGIRFTRLIHSFPILHQSMDVPLKAIPDGAVYTKDNVRDELFLRLEKQRFYRGDNITSDARFSDLVLMSIKTYVLPLKAIEACPDFARTMLNLHEGFVKEEEATDADKGKFLDYRAGTRAFINPLIDYLKSIVDVPVNNPIAKIGGLRTPEEAYSIPYN